MNENQDYKKLLNKIDSVVNEKKLDVNIEEDLCVGIMNLIGIEEHLFFTAEKTGKKDLYYSLLNEVRKMRVELLKKIVKDYEGEVWCTSKHLLAASMRMTEVGTKLLKDGNDKEAKEYFERGYNLYNLFWALNLKIVDTKTIKEKGIVSLQDIEKVRKEEKGDYSQSIKEKSAEDLVNEKEKSFFSKMGDMVKKAIDCCKE
jgi:hypothetical protein